MPTQMTSFKADIHDNSDQGNGPSLYKEFRFEGGVSGGTGKFRASMLRPATYLLVFQGRGNNCDNAGDFSDWHLDISGATADYSFFGKLDRRGESNRNKLILGRTRLTLAGCKAHYQVYFRGELLRLATTLNKPLNS